MARGRTHSTPLGHNWPCIYVTSVVNPFKLEKVISSSLIMRVIGHAKERGQNGDYFFICLYDNQTALTKDVFDKLGIRFSAST